MHKAREEHKFYSYTEAEFLKINSHHYEVILPLGLRKQPEDYENYICLFSFG